eukprot:3782096-Prymnesium_polylepis.1
MTAPPRANRGPRHPHCRELGVSRRTRRLGRGPVLIVGLAFRGVTRCVGGLGEGDRFHSMCVLYY